MYGNSEEREREGIEDKKDSGKRSNQSTVSDKERSMVRERIKLEERHLIV